MRIWPVLLAVLLIAAGAHAQDSVELRGAAEPDPVAAAQAESLLAAPPLAGSPYALPSLLPSTPPIQSPWAAQDQLQAQCAARCARDYYFCLAGETPDTCSPEWGQCRAVCSIAARRSSLLQR